MTLVGLEWADTGATDLHLLPGLVSPELKRLLRAIDSTATGLELKQLHQMPGLTVAFTAQLAGTTASHGVPMSATTGEVIVESAALKGGSFLVTATATQGAAPPVTARIRVYVHNAMTDLWLTPSKLTVRRGAKNVRLSVLAEFDDGVIGDVTNWAPFETPGGPSDHTYVHRKNSDTPMLSWAASAASPGSPVPVGVDAVTGILDATAATGQAKITVTGNARSAEAVVECAEPWNTQVRLTHLSGPGPRDVNFVPNVLFLPDGFQDPDRGEYERMVRMIVTRLSVRNRTRPFAALTGRINYFMGWVASREPGVSVLHDLDRVDKAVTPTKAQGLPVPSVTRRAPAQWKLDDLVNAIGLPNPIDPHGTTLTDARVTEWRARYGTFITKARVQPLFAEWIALNDRVLLNERDTAFHMTYGNRPVVDGAGADHAVSPNPRRMDDSDFNTFLDALRGPRGQALGQLWTTGKDRDLVVMVCRSARHGGSNNNRSVGGGKSGHTIGVGLGHENVHRLRKSTGKGFDLVPDAVPTDIYYRVWMTTAHELAHSWTLLDEYGGRPGPPPAHAIVGLAASSNVQDRASLLLPSGDLSTDKLKWGSWQRIARAGVLLLPPAPVPGGKFKLFVRDVKEAGFRPKDVVRLRTRPLPTAAEPSPRCKVESVGTGEMVIVPLFGAVVDPAKFPAGSIVMAPVRTRDPDPDADLYGGELTLADPDVLVRVIQTGNPLNAHPMAGEGAAPNDAFARPCPNVELPFPTAATNFPNRKAPNPPLFSSWTIGIYENGGEYNCGIFRPTGSCVMNVAAHFDVKTKTLNVYDFCLVCRYAIVDHVDPTRHGQVELDFIGRYGRKGAR